MLECLHDIGYSYGNNFAFTNIVFNPQGDQATFFSFERCSLFKDVKTNKHFKQVKSQTFSGDAKFSSISQMKMYTPSTRKDDLINLFYLMIFLRTMDLPWCDYLFCMPCDSHHKTFKMVLAKKEETTLSKLAKEY